MTRQVPLTRGYVALVDDCDYERVVSAGSWSARPHGPRVYAQRRIRHPSGTGFTTISLHRFITGWLFVDHCNADGLDNRRQNLRPATGTQNNANARRYKNNQSGFKGVSFDRSRLRWHARIQVNGKSRHLGRFDTAEEAARAYDVAARELFGDYARPNFPEGNA